MKFEPHRYFENPTSMFVITIIEMYFLLDFLHLNKNKDTINNFFVYLFILSFNIVSGNYYIIFVLNAAGAIFVKVEILQIYL